MRRRALLTATATIATPVLAGCIDGILVDEREESPDDGPLEVTAQELVRENEGTEDELVKVTGIAENDADTALATAEVTVEFYDGGDHVGGSSREVTDLAPGREWTFVVYYGSSGTPARAVDDYAVVTDATAAD